MQTERGYLASMLEKYEGRITAAAAAMRISRKTLWEKMRRHGMRVPLREEPDRLS